MICPLEQAERRRRRQEARQEQLEGWHDDGAEPSKVRPGRMHERESSITKHKALEERKAAERRQRGQSTSHLALKFASKMRRKSRSGEASTDDPKEFVRV